MGIRDTIFILASFFIFGSGLFIIVILIAKAVARVELAVKHRCTVDTSNIKFRWVYAAVLAVFPVVGLFLSIVSHDLSMLWVSLIGAAIAAVVFPMTFFLLFIISQVASACVAGVLMFITETIEIVDPGKRRP